MDRGAVAEESPVLGTVPVMSIEIEKMISSVNTHHNTSR